MAVYGKREFVRLDGGRSATVERHGQVKDRRSRDGAGGGRSRRLQDAIRARFPSDAAFDEWNEGLAARDPRLKLQISQLFSDIDRGHTPTTYHVYALALTAGWSFEQVAREFDVDFSTLSRLHAALGADRTHVNLTGAGFTGSLMLPTDLIPGTTRTTMALTELVGGWAKQPALTWTSTDQRLVGQVGQADNLAYPRVPSGALVSIDPTQTKPTDQGRYYLVQHPNGYSIARTTIGNGTIALLSEDRDRYPRLDFALRDVRIIGRVVAFGGRIDRPTPPKPVSLGDLMDVRRPLMDVTRMRDMSSPALLRDIWARREMTFSQFERKVRTLRRVMGPRFTIGRGHMHDLMQADASSSESVPRLEKLFALAAVFLLNPDDLLRGYGLPVDEQPSPRGGDDASASAAARALVERLRAHPIVSHIIRRGWDLPWLLSLNPARSLSSRVFYVDEISAGLTPLLKPDAFVSVNVHRRRIVSSVRGRAVETLRDWERPIYLLQTSTRHRFVCGYCETRDDTITVVPHPDAPSQRPLRFRFPDQAIVIGRVTHVATLME